MDYKEIAAVMKWHAMYSDLNGAEARLIMFMASSANYKTSKLSVSYNELAQALSLSKASVSKAIASLVEKKAVAIDEAASGRMQTTYRIRNSDELTAYFVQESINPESIKFDEDLHDLFGELISGMDNIGSDCKRCTDDNLCPQHEHQLKRMEESPSYREYKMWLADHPRPSFKIKTINGKRVLGDD